MQRFMAQASTMPILRCERLSGKAAVPRSLDVALETVPAPWDLSHRPAATPEQQVLQPETFLN